jgi:hypothetical protein
MGRVMTHPVGMIAPDPGSLLNLGTSRQTRRENGRIRADQPSGSCRMGALMSANPAVNCRAWSLLSVRDQKAAPTQNPKLETRSL